MVAHKDQYVDGISVTKQELVLAEDDYIRRVETYFVQDENQDYAFVLRGILIKT